MIPKLIHYVWVGGKPMPPLALKCMDSWKQYLPDYEIVRWDETRFDLSQFKYTEEAYRAKKYAFVADVIRLYALYHNGGVYMDTDVEIVQNIDKFLQYRAFSGFESEEHIPTGIMGAEPQHPVIGDFLDYYKNRGFYLSNGQPDLTTNVTIITEMLRRSGFTANNQLQSVNEFTLFPKTYFCPLQLDGISKPDITPDTHAIHHFAGSWLPFRLKLLKKLRPLAAARRWLRALITTS